LLSRTAVAADIDLQALLYTIFQDLPLPKAMVMAKPPAPPKKAVCAVTGLPAKYFDPVVFPTR
jgi:hypothetical protein